jgi:DNA-binding response OmpR family regulator
MNDVLILDDEPNLTVSLSLVLRQAGIACRTTRTLRQALLAVETEWPGVVLLDLSLAAGQDGWQAWERLAQAGHGRRLPVIVFAADLNDIDRAEAARRGAAGALPKTAGPQAIIAAVRAVLRPVVPLSAGPGSRGDLG